MILPLLVALLTAIGPLLRGSWDLWAQSILGLVLILGFSVWLISRISGGYIPLPSRSILFWVSALLFLSALSMWISPIRGVVTPEWHVFVFTLWIFLVIPAISRDERRWIDEAIHVSAWIMMLLAFYQHFVEHEGRPPSALLNENIYAGAILLWLPLALEKKDWLLALGLLWSLAWARSVGAWLGLSLALGLTQRRSSPVWFWTGAGIAGICAVLVYAKLGTPDAMHRWWWWKAAVRMVLARPLTGFGPGAYSYVFPGFIDRQHTNLFTLYAHEYPLQIFAEYGVLFGVLWLAGLWRLSNKHISYKAFGVIAVLIQSLWDYPLSIPSNLWLMSYFAASSIPEGSEGVNIPSRHKIPALLLVLGIGCILVINVNDLWEGQKLAVRAIEAVEAGHWDEGERLNQGAKVKTPEDPDVFVQAAQFDAQREDWFQATADLEHAAKLNPYRPATWTQWQLAYRKIGRPEEANRIFNESTRYIQPK
jgi:hypothetical protein